MIKDYDCLSVQATSIPCEQLFSLADNIVSKKEIDWVKVQLEHTCV